MEIQDTAGGYKNADVITGSCVKMPQKAQVAAPAVRIAVDAGQQSMPGWLFLSITGDRSNRPGRRVRFGLTAAAVVRVSDPKASDGGRKQGYPCARFQAVLRLKAERFGDRHTASAIGSARSTGHRRAGSTLTPKRARRAQS
jgi:hypothetical protein